MCSKNAVTVFLESSAEVDGGEEGGKTEAESITDDFDFRTITQRREREDRTALQIENR
jgi:hypothetical protein